MHITSYLFQKILLIRVEVSNNGIARLESSMIRKRKGEVLFETPKHLEIDALSKWKNTPVLFWVTGNQIVTKAYNKEDATLQRIMNNPELLWDLKTNEGQEEQLSFLRRENISALLQATEQHQLPLLDIWLYENSSEPELKARIEGLYQEGFKSSILFKSDQAKNALAELLFRKSILPVLLLFFFLLLGNFFLNSYYTKQYQQKQSMVQQSRREKQLNASQEQKRSQLFMDFNQIPNRSFALLSDRIASYIPPNMYLTDMQIAPLSKRSSIKNKKLLDIEYEIIQLKGIVDTPGAVTLLSQLLEADKLFEKVKVVQLGRKKNSDFFEFELEITI